MFKWLSNNDESNDEVDKDLQDFYGYTKEELEDMSSLEKEMLLLDELEEDEELF